MTRFVDTLCRILLARDANFRVLMDSLKFECKGDMLHIIHIWALLERLGWSSLVNFESRYYVSNKDLGLLKYVY